MVLTVDVFEMATMLICREGIILLKVDNFQVFTLENELMNQNKNFWGGHQLHFQMKSQMMINRNLNERGNII